MLRKRGRPSKSWLKTLRPFTRQDADILILKCTEAILHRPDDVWYLREYVDVRLPFNARRTSPKLPRFQIVEEDEFTILARINANKLLDCLYKMGYSKYDSKMLRKSITSISAKLAYLDRLWDNAAYFEIVDFLDASITGEDHEPKQ